MSDFFNDDFFGGNNHGNGDDIPERDRLEIDEDLNKSRKTEAEERNRNRGSWGFGNSNNNDYYGGSNNGGFRGKFSNVRNKFSRGDKRGNYSGNNGGDWTTTWIGAIVVIGVLVTVLALGNGGFSNWWKTKDRTREENVNSMITSFKRFNDTSIKKQKEIETGKKTETDRVYDVNNIYDDDGIDKQIEKEYLVFAYTGDKEKDKDFAKWVLENEDKYKIYRLNQSEMRFNTEALKYKNGKPLIYIYNEPTKNYKILDGVVDDASLLGDVAKHIDNIQEEKDAIGGAPATSKDYKKLEEYRKSKETTNSKK